MVNDNNPELIKAAGILLSKVTFDAQQVASAASEAVTASIRGSLTISFMLAYLFYMNWQLTLIAFAAFPLVGLAIRAINRRLKRVSGLVLALGDCLKTAAHDFGHVGRGKQRNADERAQEFVEIGSRRQEERQHDAGHEENGDQRDAADDLDKEDAERLYDRHA